MSALEFRDFKGEPPDDSIDKATFYLGQGMCGRPEIDECNPVKCKNTISKKGNDIASEIITCRLAVDKFIENLK